MQCVVWYELKTELKILIVRKKEMYIYREEYFHVATYKEYDKRREKGSEINDIIE